MAGYAGGWLGGGSQEGGEGEGEEGDEWTLEGGIPSVLVIEYCFKGI